MHSEVVSESEPKLCPECQETLAESDRRCSRCGHRFPPSAAQRRNLYLAGTMALAYLALALLKQLHALPSSVDPLLLGLGHLSFGFVAMTAMRRVAADNWADAGPLRRGWLGFAVAITTLMAISAVLYLVIGILAVLLWF